MTRNLWGRFTTGSIIILIGILLLLSTTGFVEFRSIWEWVPLIFVLLGVWALVRSEFRNLVGPAMIIAIAGTFFARNVGVVQDVVIGTWWPLFVVLFGVLIVISRSRRRQRIRLEGYSGAHEVTAIGVFGSDDRRVSTNQFTGAELISIFGDAMLDLRDSSIRSRPAVVEAVSIFGDVELRVPAEWGVRLEVMNVFGETIDRRPAGDAQENQDQPDLIVTGVSLFGDIEIRD